MREENLRASALKALREIIAIRAASDRVRADLVQVDPDAFSSWSAIPGSIEQAMVDLIDGVLDADGIASYLLYECRHGGAGRVIFPGGQEYRIASIEDVERLLAEQYPVAPTGAAA